LPGDSRSRRAKNREEITMRYALLWLLGIPIPVLVLLWMFGVL
jgi:hypothetical protein